MSTTRHVVAYDIRDDRVRQDVADILEGYGIRVQYSVFECRLGSRDFDRMQRRLQGALRDDANGSIRFYRICQRCGEASFALGDVEPDDESAVWVG